MHIFIYILLNLSGCGDPDDYSCLCSEQHTTAVKSIVPPANSQKREAPSDEGTTVPYRCPSNVDQECSSGDTCRQCSRASGINLILRCVQERNEYVWRKFEPSNLPAPPLSLPANPYCDRCEKGARKCFQHCIVATHLQC